MSALSIQVPFPVFQDRDGQPLENGYIWLGQPNLNPQTNPVVAYYDEALTIVAPQPLRTLNGYISNAGTPAKVYINGVNFSILVQDSKGSMVYNFPDGTGIDAVIDSCDVEYDPTFPGGVAYPLCQKLAQIVSPKDFGAVGNGVTDDQAAIQLAINSGQPIIELAGATYAVNTKLIFNQANQTFRNGTLLFNGGLTERIGNITANNVTFDNVVFHGNEKQPSSALVWVADNVQRPRFIGCTFKKLTGRAWGTNVLNAMYAVLISPYGVLNFEFRDCLFQDLLKYNDGTGMVPPTTAFVGGGFVGGVCFLPENLAPGPTAQTVVTQGTIEGCTFDNIQTIRAAGLSIADQTEFNDADAIRTYGDTNTPELRVHVSDCVFKNVSKRCFKFRASGSTAYDNECYAADLPYSMTAPLDLCHNTKVVNLKVYASVAMPVFNGVNWSMGFDYNRETLVEGLYVSHATNGMVFFSDPTFTALRNFTMRNCYFNQVYESGIFSTAPVATTYENIVIENTQFWGGANNTIGIQTFGGSSTNSSGMTVRNCYFGNCNINCGGANNNLSNVTVEVTSNTYAGPSATTNLVRIGEPANASNQFVDNLIISATNISSTFPNVNRALFYFAGTGGAFRNITLRVPQGTDATVRHGTIVGSNLLVDGLVYDGPSFIDVGTVTASSDITVMNAARTRSGGSATTQPFFASANAGTTRITFQNIVDFRDPGGSTPSISVNAGTDIAAINVVSNASAAQVVSTGGVLATVACTRFATPTQFYNPTNVTPTRSFDANTVTTADLADVVGTLIQDLRDRLIVRF